MIKRFWKWLRSFYSGDTTTKDSEDHLKEELRKWEQEHFGEPDQY